LGEKNKRKILLKGEGKAPKITHAGDFFGKIRKFINNWRRVSNWGWALTD
jgi:hypothetical protein